MIFSNYTSAKGEICDETPPIRSISANCKEHRIFYFKNMRRHQSITATEIDSQVGKLFNVVNSVGQAIRDLVPQIIECVEIFGRFIAL
uniref:Uncharacterized protein n=1 Tax=Romanomermis culicivorax TaxID=13658 RepID=A0A915HMU3_ROMCU